MSKYRDEIYGISAIWIVIFHVYNLSLKTLNPKWFIFNIIRTGYLGVEVFLFLSGVSLFFSFKKNNVSISNFYRKRVWKIARIYFFLVIPYYLLLTFTGYYTVNEFFIHLFFVNKGVSNFWFLIAIVINYLLYPIVYKLLDKNKQYVVILSIIVYVVFLFLLNYYFFGFYSRFEILLSRIPIFLVGCLFGESVYNNKQVLGKHLFFLVPLFIDGPLNLLISKISFLAPFQLVVKRLIMGWKTIGIIFTIIIILKVLEITKIPEMLRKLGKASLEIYVVHIIIRGILIYLIKVPINQNQTSVILFYFVFTIVSVISGYLVRNLFLKVDSIKSHRTKKDDLMKD